jgi:hypothetical protein
LSIATRICSRRIECTSMPRPRVGHPRAGSPADPPRWWTFPQSAPSSERVDPGPMRSCPGASSVFVERPFLFSYRMPSSSTVCLLLNNQQSPPGVDRIANAPPAGRRLGPIISIASCSPAEGGKITSRRHEQSEIPVTEPAYMLTLNVVICFHHTRQLSQDRSTVVWELM